MTQSIFYINKHKDKIYYLPDVLGGPDYDNELGGTNGWWGINGKLHRLDGPAIEQIDGTNSWWMDGKRHRENGPAIEWVTGESQWYLNDNELPTKEIEDWVEENGIDFSTNEGRMAFKLRWS